MQFILFLFFLFWGDKGENTHLSFFLATFAQKLMKKSALSN